MCHPLSSVRSPLPNRGFPVRRLPLAVAAVCLFACGEDSEPPGACGSIPQQTLGLKEEVRLAPCFEDPEGEELKLTASSSDVEVATAAAQDSAISVKGVSPGSATIAVVATDPAGQTARQEFGVAVLGNRAPELCDDTPPQISTTLEVRQTAFVVPCFEDPDGEETGAYRVVLEHGGGHRPRVGGGRQDQGRGAGFRDRYGCGDGPRRVGRLTRR